MYRHTVAQTVFSYSIERSVMKTYRRKFLATIVASTALLGGAAFAQPQKPLVVACDTAFVPFEFKQGDKYVGFDIDLWDAIAKDMGVSYKLQPMDFNGIIPGLQTKNIDAALAGITIKEERQKVVDFSDPYYESGISILTTTKNAATIKTVKDLADKDVAVKTGTVGVDFLKKEQPLAKLKLFPNIDNAFLDLATGRVAAVGAAQKAETVGQNFQHAVGNDLFPGLGPLLDDRKHQLLLAHAASVVDFQRFGLLEQLGDVQGFEFVQVHGDRLAVDGDPASGSANR